MHFDMTIDIGDIWDIIWNILNIIVNIFTTIATIIVTLWVCHRQIHHEECTLKQEKNADVIFTVNPEFLNSIRVQNEAILDVREKKTVASVIKDELGLIIKPLQDIGIRVGNTQNVYYQTDAKSYFDLISAQGNLHSSVYPLYSDRNLSLYFTRTIVTNVGKARLKNLIKDNDSKITMQN